jgi:hypothetical protein
MHACLHLLHPCTYVIDTLSWRSCCWRPSAGTCEAFPCALSSSGASSSSLVQRVAYLQSASTHSPCAHPLHPPTHPHACRQLLLVEQGRADQARLYLEQRQQLETLSISREKKAPSSDEQQRRREVAALCRCYVLDILSDGMGQWDDALAWLERQQQLPEVSLVPSDEAAQLIKEVQQRRPAAASSSPASRSPSAPVTPAPATPEAAGGAKPAAASASASAAPAWFASNDAFTMTGMLNDEDWEPRRNLAANARPVELPENEEPGPSARAAAVPSDPPEPSALERAARGVAAAVDGGASRLRVAWEGLSGRSDGAAGARKALSEGGGVLRVLWESSGISRRLLPSLIAAVVVFAMVAERAALGAAAKSWLRQLRAGVRELLAMGFVLTSSP